MYRVVAMDNFFTDADPWTSKRIGTLAEARAFLLNAWEKTMRMGVESDAKYGEVDVIDMPGSYHEDDYGVIVRKSGIGTEWFVVEDGEMPVARLNKFDEMCD